MSVTAPPLRLDAGPLLMPAEAALAVEGIHCGSCVQLIELRVGELPGVSSVKVSQATHRARIKWNSSLSSLQEIVGAISRAGYRAWPVSAAGVSAQRRHDSRRALWRIFVAGFAMMQVMMYAFPAYVAGSGDIEPDIDRLLKIACFVLTFPVMVYSAGPFFAGAWRDMRFKRVGMDVPVALAILVTFGYSAVVTFVGDGPVYYDSVTMFVFLVLGGKYIESVARGRATSAIEELTRLQPEMARRLARYPDSAESGEIPAADLRVGDFFVVRNGERCAADGIVVEGSSLNDESLLTGEATPADKSPGKPVIGGAINLGAPLIVRVTSIGVDSRLAGIVRLVERAADQKPALVKLADSYAKNLLGGILILALLAGAVWAWIDPSRALWVVVAILVVTCPCALSLAAPLALSATVGNLASRGVLISSGHALETLTRVNHFVFDKTGTLTTGRMAVQQVILLGNMTRESLSRVAGALEQWAVHPVAQSLAMYTAPAMRSGPPPMILDYREVTGAGVEGRVNGVLTRIGSIDFAAALHSQAFSPEVRGQLASSTVAAMADENGWLGVFVLRDGIRNGGREMVASLKAAGCRATLLTGDNARAGKRVAAELGIDDVQSGASPEAKQAFVAQLQRDGAIVAMVGDGINDAPVLAQAHVSIAMGSGAPLAQSRADMVLMSASPADLWRARAMASKTMRVIRQNLGWAVAYNLIAIPFAVTGHLNPWMAGLGMTFSSLVVVANSLRLLERYQREPALQAEGIAA